MDLSRGQGGPRGLREEEEEEVEEEGWGMRGDTTSRGEEDEGRSERDVMYLGVLQP